MGKVKKIVKSLESGFYSDENLPYLKFEKRMLAPAVRPRVYNQSEPLFADHLDDVRGLYAKNKTEFKHIVLYLMHVIGTHLAPATASRSVDPIVDTITAVTAMEIKAEHLFTAFALKGFHVTMVGNTVSARWRVK